MEKAQLGSSKQPMCADDELSAILDAIPQPIIVKDENSRFRFLAALVRDALRESGLEASRLQLEITESVLLDESDTNLHILQEFSQLGAKIAMDDFGTGYSSLSYLRTFPFDKIKVDREFINDLPTGKESLATVRAVAGIGRRLGITTTVEGWKPRPSWTRSTQKVLTRRSDTCLPVLSLQIRCPNSSTPAEWIDYSHHQSL